MVKQIRYFIQLIDPTAFTSRENYQEQNPRRLRKLADDSKADSKELDVRLPGKLAWQRRSDQLINGVNLYPTIMEDLKPWAEKFNVKLPGT